MCSIFVVLSISLYTICVMDRNFSFVVLEIANTLMIALSVASFFLAFGQLEARPQAFVRGVTAASFLKIMVCMIAVLVYVLLNKQHIYKPTVFVLGGIYMVYSIIEKKLLSKTVRG
jgi:hypothetical protein